VVWRRSTASVAMATAVSNPNVRSVPTMSLSMVFGTPTIGTPRRLRPSEMAIVPSPPMATIAASPRSFT
jgi:hypothetical protein